MYQFDPPHTFPAREAAALGNVADSRLPDPNGITAKLHVTWGHASARRLKRVLVYLSEETAGGETALQQRDVCRAFDKRPLRR